MPTLEFKRIKCVLVGDGSGGKSCFIKMVTAGQFPETYSFSGLCEEHLHQAVLRDQQIIPVKFCYSRKLFL